MVPNYCCNDNCSHKSFDCFWVEATSTNFAELLKKDTEAYIPDIMHIAGTDKRRGVYHSSHFTVVGGYDKVNSAYRDYDPGQRYGLPAQGYNQLYDPYNFIKLLRFKDAYYQWNNAVDESIIYGTVHSPVEMLMIDPLGRRTGYDPATGTKLTENPMSHYSVEEPISSLDPDALPGEPYKQLVIVYPPEGNYILQIFGTGNGPYTIDLKSTTYDGTANLKTSFTGTATPSLLQTYRITYSSTGEASLSQTNQAPVAHAGANQTGEQSYEIALDGSASYDPDGDRTEVFSGDIA